MDFEEIKQIIELFSKSKVDGLKLQNEGWTLKLKKDSSPKVVYQNEAPLAASPAPAPVAAPAAPQEPAAAPAQPEDDGLFIVNSPIVGTFYASPNPNSEPFIKIGDRVEEGQTLCIVEAMKLMNEIQAERAGVVEKIFVENAQGVEYGQKLFGLK